mmetsp:Transcript_78703/g.206557  ORF Transcript_78703/g.206557 Transcript_78703/m.206557 type:complete len:384 (+) Transcript_78703:722-1873(+)
MPLVLSPQADEVLAPVEQRRVVGVLGKLPDEGAIREDLHRQAELSPRRAHDLGVVDVGFAAVDARLRVVELLRVNPGTILHQESPHVPAVHPDAHHRRDGSQRDVPAEHAAVWPAAVGVELGEVDLEKPRHRRGQVVLRSQVPVGAEEDHPGTAQAHNHQEDSAEVDGHRVVELAHPEVLAERVRHRQRAAEEHHGALDCTELDPDAQRDCRLEEDALALGTRLLRRLASSSEEAKQVEVEPLGDRRHHHDDSDGSHEHTGALALRDADGNRDQQGHELGGPEDDIAEDCRRLLQVRGDAREQVDDAVALDALDDFVDDHRAANNQYVEDKLHEVDQGDQDNADARGEHRSCRRSVRVLLDVRPGDPLPELLLALAVDVVGRL